MRGFEALLAVAAAFALPLQPQGAGDHPNFSGKWVMVKDKSEFGKFPPPELLVRLIEQHDPTMTVKTTQRQPGQSEEVTTTVTYNTEGAETKNEIRPLRRGGAQEAQPPAAIDTTSKAHWEGQVLVVETKLKAPNGTAIAFRDRWELSADGAELITASHIAAPNGEADLKLVSSRQ